MPRNSPTIFNLGFNTQGLFWDSRVESRCGGAILTPDSPVDLRGRHLSDPNLPQGTTLAAAQAKFLVTSSVEMRGQFVIGSDNQELRAALTISINVLATFIPVAIQNPCFRAFERSQFKRLW